MTGAPARRQATRLTLVIPSENLVQYLPTANGHEALGPNADALLTQICTPKSIPWIKPVILRILESDYTFLIYQSLPVAYKHVRNPLHRRSQMRYTFRGT